eukprot:2497427-Alexandrium_andersonii.AAC.1
MSDLPCGTSCNTHGGAVAACHVQCARPLRDAVHRRCAAGLVPCTSCYMLVFCVAMTRPPLPHPPAWPSTHSHAHAA